MLNGQDELCGTINVNAQGNVPSEYCTMTRNYKNKYNDWTDAF